MTMMTTTNRNQQQLGSVQQQEADQMDSDYYKENEDCWCSVTRTVVGKHIFDVCQFITCKEDEMYGSEWQQQVCSKQRWTRSMKSYSGRRRACRKLGKH